MLQVPKQVDGLKSEEVVEIAAARDHTLFLCQRYTCYICSYVPISNVNTCYNCSNLSFEYQCEKRAKLWIKISNLSLFYYIYTYICFTFSIIRDVDNFLAMRAC
jgi:hypothetical protein